MTVTGLRDFSRNFAVQCNTVRNIQHCRFAPRSKFATVKMLEKSHKASGAPKEALVLMPSTTRDSFLRSGLLRDNTVRNVLHCQFAPRSKFATVKMLEKSHKASGAPKEALVLMPSTTRDSFLRSGLLRDNTVRNVLHCQFAPRSKFATVKMLEKSHKASGAPKEALVLMPSTLFYIVGCCARATRHAPHAPRAMCQQCVNSALAVR